MGGGWKPKKYVTSFFYLGVFLGASLVSGETHSFPKTLNFSGQFPVEDSSSCQSSGLQKVPFAPRALTHAAVLSARGVMKRNTSLSVMELEALATLQARQQNTGTSATASTPYKLKPNQTVAGPGPGSGESGVTAPGGLSMMLLQNDASPAAPGSGPAFWQKCGLLTSPVSVLMIPALNMSVDTTRDEMECDFDGVGPLSGEGIWAGTFSFPVAFEHAASPPLERVRGLRSRAHVSRPRRVPGRKSSALAPALGQRAPFNQQDEIVNE